MSPQPTVPEAVVAFYDRYDEHTRCLRGAGQLEYERTLVDPVPRHVDEAREAAGRRGLTLAGCSLGSASALPAGEAEIDALLLLLVGCVSARERCIG